MKKPIPPVVSLTNEDLLAYCVKWQKILRLQDWDVKIEFARAFDIQPNRNAEVDFVAAKKTALIKILVPGDYPTDIRWPQDIEQTVIHELLHLHLAWADDLTPFVHTQMEQAINCLAPAFVGLGREK